MEKIGTLFSIQKLCYTGSIMNKNEWYQVGEDIKKQVQQAIDTNDFSELSKSIGETVGLAVGDVSKSLSDVSKGLNDIGKSINDVVNEAAGSFQKGMDKVTAKTGIQGQPSANRQKWERYNGSVYYAKPNLRPDPKLFNNTPAGSVSGVIWMLAGLGAMGYGGWLFVQHMWLVLMGSFPVDTLLLPLAATTTGVGMGVYGARLRNRVDRFKHYVAIVKDKLYCSIEDMADKTGRSPRYVRRDLKKMMQKGMFLQAHLDKKESCFIASDAMYEQYMLTQKQYEQQLLLENKDESKRKDTVSGSNSSENATSVLDERATKVLEEGRAYIDVIRRCNDEIPGEEMSEKLDKMEFLVTRIFARVEENPEQAAELQKMLSYYLPTTQKLLEAYRDLDKQDVEVKNISDTKREIETTVDTINRAFEGFLDELFRDRAWDIQSDISVLNTMLKQDGYIKSDFEKGDK